MVKSYAFVMNIYVFFTPPPAHRWTVIGMGALREHPAIGALSTAGGPLVRAIGTIYATHRHRHFRNSARTYP